MTSEEIERAAASVPAEERPVSASRLSGLGDFLGIYGGEHFAATEFVIGALLVTWGVRAGELLFGLAVGNLLATCMYALCTAPIAVDTRLSLFAYLRKVAGPWFQRAYNVAWGVTSIFYAAAMTAFDQDLKILLTKLRRDDVLIITADHGCDPSTPSTDHSREYTPMLIYGDGVRAGVDLGTRGSFADIGATVLDCLGVSGNPIAGESFWNNVKGEV